jgi:hypothetical protein
MLIFLIARSIFFTSNHNNEHAHGYGFYLVTADPLSLFKNLCRGASKNISPGLTFWH